MRNTIVILSILLLAFTGCSKKISEELPVEVESELETPRLLHPAFNLTEDDLSELCSGLPESVNRNIKERSEYFLQLILDVHPWNSDLTVLVNKEQSLNREGVPEDLVSLDEYKDQLLLSRSGHRLRAATLPSLLAMVEKAEQEDIDLIISSSYRSFEYQEGLYNRYVERDGQEAADRYSARPGKSQHQLGTAIDFGSIDDSFALTAAGKWVKENAWLYGFSMSYPEGMESYTGYVWESWHFRYIGENASKLEKEFFDGIQERMLRFINNKSNLLEAALI
ncbi:MULTISPECIES: M15 family metallopeptidase [unclassified Oceanispirochaeta]|uniref:M15 family metallopeptidase n=1 Tax=unclassified Oceanispirochaeta TaxID=2635722 RepID=UPI0011C029A4|nr:MULTISPECIES: M15 family metallopeptidase [unclassified Oceanispirochaeta]MBF9016232.1 M15 family metallopeptidase [Oceanispirochaeta sp. M2]NPD72694.1 M15 family metallopeptidase [Oceanispirochaeta sp. M1]